MPRREEDLFHACLDLPADRREAWLEAEIPGDATLRARVLRLIEAHERASDRTLRPLVEFAGPPEPAPDRIGSYAITGVLGEGGMGVVYDAEQTEPVRRRVALKVIKAGMDTRQVVARFLAERQALAAMDHPFVAKVLDAGQTPSGRPYFVMERVEGEPLLEYCTRRSFGVRARIELFVQICQAVQHAHQKGVIHRDLKPSNVLVIDGEAGPRPKVIDFGISKAMTDDPNVPGAPMTHFEQRLGTPAYMSPEQAAGADVDTRTDIYALGVILYELLAGRVPVDPRESREAIFLQRLAAGEVDPPPPSARAADVRLPADLDAIVMKALAVERARRYDTAVSLAEDLGRHLRDEPVVARPPTTSYRMRKFVRRNRAAVVATAVTVLALLAALGVSAYQTRVAVAERDRAERRFSDLRQLANALIFKIHDSVRALPGSTEARRAIVAEALTYLERLSADEATDPVLQHELARGYLRIGNVQGRPSEANLGDREGALKSLGKAVALLDALVTRPTVSSAVVRDLIEARVAYADVQRVLGQRGAALDSLGSAVTIAEQLAARDPAPENRVALGMALFQQALLAPTAESLPLWTRALEVFDGLLSELPDHPGRQRNVALVHKQIGTYHANRRDAAAARQHHLRALELDERRLAAAPNHAGAMFDVAIDLANLAKEASKTGDHSEAIRLYERSAILRQRLVEADPKDVQAQSRLAYVHASLAYEYLAARQPGQAASHARRSVSIAEPLAAVDAYHKVELSASLLELGRSLQAQGRSREGCAAFVRASGIVRDLRAARADTNTERLAFVEATLTEPIQSCR